VTASSRIDPQHDDAARGAASLVSIILPTWNRAAVLERAIASVRAQTHEAWELIVEDDGSDDGTSALLARLSAGEPRLVLCGHDRWGPGASRNHGLTHARGAYVTYLDSDDEYLPDHLALRVAWMEAHPDVDLVHGGVVVVGPRGSDTVADVRDPSRRIAIADCAVGGTFFARTALMRAHGRWTDDYGEDYRLLHALEPHARIVRVDFATYLYHRDGPPTRCDSAAGESHQSDT
jgi:glycosyltransferase involved in cell wall biosynthesis